jgi:hypothetical protein
MKEVSQFFRSILINMKGTPQVRIQSENKRNGIAVQKREHRLHDCC